MGFNVVRRESLVEGKGERFFVDVGPLEPKLATVLILLAGTRGEIISNLTNKLIIAEKAIEQDGSRTLIRLASGLDERAAENWRRRLEAAYTEFRSGHATI